jgi:serine protease Do
MRRGDVVVAIDDHEVKSTGEFRNSIAAAGAKTVDLTLSRNGRREHVRAELTLAPDDDARDKPHQDSAQASGTAGMRLAPLDADARARLQLPPSIKSGAVVRVVEPGSAASEAGLEPGDVILEANRAVVSSPQRLEEAWRKSDKPMALLIWREGHTFYAVLKH